MKSQNNITRGILLPFLFLCFVLIVIGFVIFFIIGETKSKEVVNYAADKPVISLQLNELDQERIATFPFEAWEKVYLSTVHSPLLAISLEYLYIPSDFISSDEKVCIKRLDIKRHDVKLTDGNIILNLVDEESTLCGFIGQNFFVFSASEATAELEAIADASLNYMFYNNTDFSDVFYYPFDRREIEFDVIFEVYKDKKNSIEAEDSDIIDVSSETVILANFSHEQWSVNIDTAPLHPIDKREAVNILINLNRFLPYRVFSFVLPLVVILLIMFLHWVYDIGSFLEVTVGILLGLWGLYEVLTPEYIQSLTIVTLLVYALYSFLAGFLVLELVRRKPWRDEGETIAEMDSPADNNVDIKELALRIPVQKGKSSLFKWAIGEINLDLTKKNLIDAFVLKASLCNDEYIKTKEKLLSVAREIEKTL